MFRSMPTSSAPSLAGAPACALVPALDRLDVGKPALDRDLPRDRLGERTAARVAGADEQDLHAVTRLRSGWARSRAASRPEIAPGRMTRGRRPVQSITVDGFDGCQRAAVEHPQLATRHRVAPLRQNLSGAHGRGNPRTVGARRRDRVAVRVNQSRRCRRGSSSERRCHPPDRAADRARAARRRRARASTARASGASRDSPRSRQPQIETLDHVRSRR